MDFQKSVGTLCNDSGRSGHMTLVTQTYHRHIWYHHCQCYTNKKNSALLELVKGTPRVVVKREVRYSTVGGFRAAKFTCARVLLSLYSTATQNHSRWVLVLVYTPNATVLCYLYQHVGI